MEKGVERMLDSNGGAGRMTVHCTGAGFVTSTSSSLPQQLGVAPAEVEGVHVGHFLHGASACPLEAPLQSVVQFRGGDACLLSLHLAGREVMTDGALLLHFEEVRPGLAPESVLADSEEVFGAFFRDAFDAILVANADGGEILAANGAMAETFGVHLDVLHQLRVGDLIVDGEAMFGVRRERTRRQLRRRNGEVFPAEVSVLPYHAHDGSARISLVVRELTELEAGRRSSRDAYEAISQIVDQAPVMMATAQGAEHVFTRANRRYLETLGLRDIVGKRVIDVLPETEAQGIIDILDRVYTTGEPFTAQELPMDLDVEGALTRFYFDLVYQPMRNPDGSVSGFLANVNDVTSKVHARHDLERLNEALRIAYDATIEGWARALDLKDEETAGHSWRVTEWTVALARELGIEGGDLESMRRGALLHDIGKMGVPDDILLKPGPLTPDEWEVMRGHTTYARELLEPISFLGPALDIPVHHHEKWDGSGYPDGLAGDDIPFAARIFAVVDVFDALSSDRPYRSAWSVAAALEHIRAASGTHFDPEVVCAFERIIAP